MLRLGSLCRHVEGRDLKSIIEAVQKKVRSKSTPKAEVAALSAWVWQLTLHVASALAQVCGCPPRLLLRIWPWMYYML